MKEPIALLLNDIHISKDNLAEFDKNWDEMRSVCRKYNIEDVIIGGDFFTTRSAQTLSTLLTVRDALDRAVSQGLFLTIAEGNHDKTDPESIYGYNHLWRGLKNIDIVDWYRLMVWEDNVALLVISYFPESDTFLRILEETVNDSLSSNLELKKEDIILYIHEGVHGALGDFDIPNELPQESLAGFRAVLCGHYHNRIKIPNTNIEYIGASRQHNFGEDEEKGYTILYSDGSYGFIKNEVNTRYKNVEIEASDVESLDLDLDERYKYKVKVKCNEQQVKTFDKQKLIDMGFHKVEVVSEVKADNDVADVDIQKKYDRQELKTEYRNYCNEKSIDCNLGIKYLEA